MKDCSNGKLLEALLFARTREDNSLLDCLANLTRGDINVSINRGKTFETIIGSDYAQHSFTFARMNSETGECSTNGGIIFHGKHDNGGDGSAPTFSVCLTPCDGWRIHT